MRPDSRRRRRHHWCLSQSPCCVVERGVEFGNGVPGDQHRQLVADQHCCSIPTFRLVVCSFVQAGRAGSPGWAVAADGRHSWIRPDGRRATKESAPQLGQVLSAVIPDGRSRRRQPRHTSRALLDCCDTGLININRIHSCEGLQLFRIASVRLGLLLAALVDGRHGWAGHRPVIMRSSSS